MQDYAELRHTLEARRQELRERLSGIQAHLQRGGEPLPQDFAEQAVARENDQVIEALEGEVRAELREIERALHAMDIGEYGVCEVCGAEIPLSRLRILPATRLCVACAERRERGRG
ncbi:MAG TPA: TraR/DksA family transcriptional regulator [Candidatus Competibacteraceae bacterium]|nr:TraR/DksA family transcriptional regulator [Candidatus Competibacteraceae bacterium]